MKKTTNSRDVFAIQLDDDDFGLMLNCAVRYAIGRHTYMPHAVISFITPLLPHLSIKTLWCFDRDIAEQENRGGYGDPKIDEPGWRRFHEKVKTEIVRRNNNV